MTSIGYATLSVIPTFDNVRKQLEQGMSSHTAAAGRTSGKRLGDALGNEAGKSFKSRFGSSLRDLGPLAAGAGATALFTDLIGSASEAQQAVGGVRAVFKDYADGVIADSRRASQSLGLASTDYQQLVTISGALLKNKGLIDFADQSERLVQIGADLAAQYGGSTKDAVDALNSALRGESDPIERYAISLNETAIKAELLAQGQANLTGAALEQAKTMARLSLIQQQSADAQGAFARESDTLAGSQQRLAAQWADMRAELGTKLLPATSQFVSFLNTEALPALSGAGSAVGAAAEAFGDLPGPVKNTAAALAAMRLASHVGATARLTEGMQNLRTSLTEIRSGSASAKAGLASLGKQAGIAAAAVATIELWKGLQPDAASESAVNRFLERLDVLAGPERRDRIAAISEEIERQQKVIDDAFGPTFNALGTRITPFEFGSDWKVAGERVDALKEQLKQLQHEEELGRITSLRSGTAVASMADKFNDARGAVLKLLDAENKRRDSALQDRRDRISLLDTLAATRQAAREGALTLDENTRAGRENMSALLDLADQWNQSAPKVRNARGAYSELREQFIRLADQMNGPDGPRRAAVRLADELLALPKRRVVEIDTPGMKEALRDLDLLRAKVNLEGLNRVRISVGALPALAGGGVVGGFGSGTSDSNLIWASRGEFMQRKAAVDYYGLDFMRKLNALQIPRYAQGGPIAPAGRPSVSHAQTFGPIYIQAHDYDDFMTQLQRRKARQAIGGIPIGRNR